MVRFLHIADIHLGFNRYNSSERTKDFFFALYDVVQKYAIAPGVDFVVICGDLFEHRQIQPAILNQAQICFQALKAAGIPVLAIEGNHDNTPYGTLTSWLRYLSDQEMLILLSPGGEPFYEPWDPARKRGGYIDLPCGVRVLGSQWYGATAPQAIAKIAQTLPTLPPAPGPTVLLFHHGLEGQIARYSGALRYRDLLPLRDAGVDYLALGHIHKHYTEGGWVFNPGSLEANTVEEGSYERGALLVTLEPGGAVTAALQRDYRQRPIVRLRLALRHETSAAAVREAAIALVTKAITQGDIQPEQRPIVELRISGTVPFDPLDLDTRHLQTTLQAQTKALVFLLRYTAESTAYAAPVNDDAGRDEIETSTFLDCLAARAEYDPHRDTLARGLVELKNRCLEGEPERDLYGFVESLLMEAK